jgi:ABC-type lipoprotein export system ATPase subunit
VYKTRMATPAVPDATPEVAALRIRDLVKSYPSPGGGRVEALRLPALDLARGEALAIAGESGSGKTTLLHLIAGILRADGGTIEVMGRAMTGRGETARDRLRAATIGYLFQTFNLLPHLTALENVALGMTFRPRVAESPRKGARRALERVGLATHVHHRPAQLSTGQQQRVAIARALAGHPGLVLADEPTASLDPITSDQCLDLLQAFAAEERAALLVVTHDAPVLARFPRRLTLEPAPRPVTA